MLLRSALLTVWCIGLATFTSAQSNHTDKIEFFERKIRPLLSEHCFSCHSSSAKTVHGGLRLDSAESLKRGGDSGPAINADSPDESLLIQAVRYHGDFEMPPSGKLADRDIDMFVAWVRAGAAFPKSIDDASSVPREIDFQAGREFWSFKPLRSQARHPEVHSDWPNRRIDFYTLASMQQHGLAPSPPADRATLLRRLSFTLTGLPPTRTQVRDFLNDDSIDAYRRQVEMMLRSPQYGEHWGRWWLDHARYTDRTASWLYQDGQAHYYRDWVIKALNDDVPYDDFVRRQLATDLMDETGPDDLPALGFLSLSPTYWKELKLPCEIIKVIVADEWEERVDAVSRTFLGLTAACARCHDHKFDPISSEDYYALAGVFASSRQVERPMISEEAFQPVREARHRVKEIESEIAKLKKQKPKPKDKIAAEDRIAELESQIAKIKSSTPRYNTPMASALSEESMFVVRKGKTAQDGTKLEYRAEPRDLPAFIRGNPNRPGKIVPRRFLTVLAKDSKPYSNGSGRLELAESILNDAAPLAARVIVNRVWLQHYGRGIVETPSNFGAQGSLPSHPELLDDLASGFIANGWSLKWLHREILLSSTWRQSSASDGDRASLDPENKWLSRMNRRRLSFEQWRDAMLRQSGDLDTCIGGPSLDLDSAKNHRRTVYTTVHRRDMSSTLMIHDFPDPTQHSPQRTSTITALQGLYALNGPLLIDQAQKLVKRLSELEIDDERERVGTLYELLYARAPTDRELELAKAFLGESNPRLDIDRWQQYVHVLLASNEMMFID